MRLSQLRAKKRNAKEKAKIYKFNRAIKKECKNVPNVIDSIDASVRNKHPKMPEGNPPPKAEEEIPKPLISQEEKPECIFNPLTLKQEGNEAMPKALAATEAEKQAPLNFVHEEVKEGDSEPVIVEEEDDEADEEERRRYVDLSIEEVDQFIDKLETMIMQENLSSIFESLKKGKRKGTFVPLSAIPDFAVDNYKAAHENRRGCRASVYCLVKGVKRVLLPGGRHLTILTLTDESIFPQYCIAKMYSEQMMEIECNWIIKLVQAKPAIATDFCDKYPSSKFLVPRLFWNDVFGSCECFDSFNGKLLSDRLSRHCYHNNKASYEERYGKGIMPELLLKLQQYVGSSISETEYQAIICKNSEVDKLNIGKNYSKDNNKGSKS